MPVVTLKSRALFGMRAPAIIVEVHLARGLPAFTIVGLPEAEVRESRERVRAALQTCGFQFPARRITVNLAPADLRKESGRYDLPIALGILAASGQLSTNHLQDYEFAGELSLTGQLRSIRGALAMTYAMTYPAQSSSNVINFILPADCAAEAALVRGIKVFSASDLLSVCAHLNGTTLLSVQSYTHDNAAVETEVNLSDIHGQLAARRALEIAAAGGHSMLLVGPPGSGKTMLANRLLSILPALNQNHALEIAALVDLSGTSFNLKNWLRRPFRAPHHSISRAALVGGGSIPRPGEISLAHHGILFLDEFPEFSRSSLEALREPLQSGWISISRAARQAEFPAKFQLIAAMNPCPCGYFGHPLKACTCLPSAIKNYQLRISGPLMDRIDMRVLVPSLNATELLNISSGESSNTVAMRVMKAITLQITRQNKTNKELTSEELNLFCVISKEGKALIAQAQSSLNYSSRAVHRILRLARTIADLFGASTIELSHLAEAIQYQRAGTMNLG